MKTRLKIFFLAALVGGFVLSCSHEPTSYFKIAGYTQGTTYHMTYENVPNRNLTQEVDSILHVFDLSLSTYIDNSLITKVNRNETNEVNDDFFKVVFNKSAEIWKNSDGAFDITVAPIVNAYGFGFTDRVKVNDNFVDSLLDFVGFNKIHLHGNTIIKDDPRIMLDPNAIAQGYSVDVICDFFESLGIHNYMVEIGGELKAKGKNPEGQIWRIGVDKPQEGNSIPGEEFQAIVNLENKALATSGNYRKFYEEDGVKYAHSINPKTGKPVLSNLLSATIVAEDGLSADGYATACMVLGLEKAKTLIKNHPELHALFIYSDSTGNYQLYFSPGMEAMTELP